MESHNDIIQGKLHLANLYSLVFDSDRVSDTPKPLKTEHISLK